MLAGRLKINKIKVIQIRGESKRASGIFSVVLLIIVDHFVLKQVEKQVGSEVAVR